MQNQTAMMRPSTLVLIVSVWIATIGNFALWRHLTLLLELHNLRGLGFGLVFCVIVASGTCAVLTLFNWRWLVKPVLMFYLVAAAIGVYYMLDFGVVLDVSMMTNVVQTNPGEARDLLGWRFWATLLILGLLPAFWVWRQALTRPRLARRALVNLAMLVGSIALLAGAILLVFQDFSSMMRNHTQLRYEINPLNSLYSLGVIAAKPYRRDTKVLLPLGDDAQLGASYARQDKPPLLLLVLGETARAANFGVDGYARPTTPNLSQLDAAGKIASQRNAWSCGTNTAASLPCMFSHLGRADFDDRKANHENLLDVLRHAGLAVLWIDNQSGCKGVCDRVARATTSDLKDPGLCAGGECFDAIMLKNLEQRIAALPPERVAKGVVIVMHQMGSHGPAYYKRSPAEFKKFTPECTSNALQDCSQELIVNAYDNTILYTDHFLFSAQKELDALVQRFSGAMIYVSDHGESLGENNLYLHGLPWRVAPDDQKHVPWIIWLSPQFEARSGASMECLRARIDEKISHDNYFHSVLGLMDVRTSVYRPELDLFRPCVSE